MPELKNAEWMIVLAALAGPVLAVQAQKFIERAREKREAKQRLFYALMGTRAARVAPDHVRALNMIDLEFYGRKIFFFRFQYSSEKNVINAWHIYQDHLNQPWNAAGEPPAGIQAWTTRGDELFTELLYFISVALGFDFDRVQLRRGIYNPRAHDENEAAYLLIRNGLVRLLNGTQPLKMEVTSFPVAQEDIDRQRQVQASLLEHLDGNRSLRIKIESGEPPGTD
jgi:hypothetical protein